MAVKIKPDTSIARTSCRLSFLAVYQVRVLLLAETAQVHRVADHLDPVKGRKDERNDDQQGILEAVDKFRLVRKLQPAGLLGQTNIMVIALNIGKVAQGKRYRVGSFIVDANAIQRGSKFAGIGGEQEDHPQRDNRGIFENLVTW